MNKKTLLILLLLFFLVVLLLGYLFGKKTHQRATTVPTPTQTLIDVAGLTPPPVAPYPGEPKNVLFTLLQSDVSVPQVFPIYSAKSLGDMGIIAQALASKVGAVAQSNNGKPTRLWRTKDITVTVDPTSASLYYSDETTLPTGSEPTIQGAQQSTMQLLNDLSLRQLTNSMTVRDSRVVSKNQRAPGATQNETVVSLSYDISIQRAYSVLSVPPLSPALITTTGTNNTIRSLSLVAQSIPGDKIRDAQILSRDQIVDALQRGLARLVFVDPKTGLFSDWSKPPSFTRVSIDRVEIRYAYYPSEGTFRPVLVLFGLTDAGPRVSYVLSAVQ